MKPKDQHAQKIIHNNWKTHT